MNRRPQIPRGPIVRTLLHVYGAPVSASNADAGAARAALVDKAPHMDSRDMDYRSPADSRRHRTLAIWIPRKNVAHIGIRRGCRLVRLAQARPGTGKDWPLLHHIALGHGDRTDASRYRRRTATCYRRRCRPEQTHHQRRAERGFARRQSSPARERVFSKSASPALAGCPFERVMTLATLIGRGNSSATLSIR